MMPLPHAVALIWSLGNIGKQAFVDQQLARLGLTRAELRCDINRDGYVACAFASLGWALFHPWAAPGWRS